MSAVSVGFPGPGECAVAVTACGDGAVLVTMKSADAEASWRHAHHIAEWIERQNVPGVLGTVATYDTLLVEFDPVEVGFDEIAAVIRAGSDAPHATWPGRPRRRVVVPVAYGGEFGPDLEDAAAELGLKPDELIRRHHATPYVIRCVVSPAGAPMTAGPELPAPLARLTTPRVAVPGGSVALAGRQATLYATPSPGGWRLIGRTPVTLVDPHRVPPVPYDVGDLLEYVPISAEQWPDYRDEPVEVRDA